MAQAAALPAGSIERLLRVAAFALAPYATGGAPQRARKPFDGMLGGEWPAYLRSCMPFPDSVSRILKVLVWFRNVHVGGQRRALHR